MTIKAGSSVRTTKSCSGLSAKGAEEVAEGTKGTVLKLEGGLVLVSLRESGAHVYLREGSLAATKGRPLKAESLALALAAHRPTSVEVETVAASA